MDVFQVGSDSQRLVTRGPQGEWIVCSEGYDFNGDTVAVFGQRVQSRGDTDDAPAYGKRVPVDEALAARAVQAVRTFEHGFKVTRKWKERQWGGLRRAHLAERLFFRGEQQVVEVDADTWTRLQVGQVYFEE